MSDEAAPSTSSEISEPVAITVVLTLDETLSALTATAAQQVTAALNDVAHSLGIPGDVVLELRYQPLLQSAPEQLLRLTVNRQLCRYPAQLLEQVRGYLCDRLPDAEVSPSNIAAWLMEESNSTKPSEFLGMTCAEIVKLQPACLLDEAALSAYRTSLLLAARAEENQIEVPDAAWLQPVLHRLLDFRLSLTPVDEIVRAVSTFRARGQEDVFEDLVVALSSTMIELHLPLAYLQWLVSYNEQKVPEELGFIRAGLRDETGLIYPALQFVADETLRPNSFAFKINAVVTLPQIGLEADEYLVNDTPSRLRLLNVEARSALIPESLLPGSVVQLSDPGKLTSSGLTTWDAAGYVALSCAARLREFGGCFLRRDSVESLLSKKAYWNRTLTGAVRDSLSIEECTRVLRALVAEGISLRYWRLILEAIIDGCILDNGRTNQHKELLQFVRHRLQRVISYKYARGTNTLVAYLLSTDIETRLAQYNPGANNASEFVDEEEQIIAAVQAELSYLPRTAQVPVVLTTDAVRAKLARVLRPVFPRMSVIAHDDLVPDLNVQPVARIGLS